MAPQYSHFALALAALLWLAPSGVHASEDGIASTDCNGCHSGGSGTTSATISFSSPLIVGQPATISVGMTDGSGALTHGGFNLLLSRGNFSNPPGAGSQRLAAGEATHTAPRSSQSWNLTWTPSATGTVNYTLWVNAVNNDGLFTSDRPAASARVGSVTVLRANGTSCSSNGQCGSNRCVDGVCCNTSCTGTCFACSPAAGGQASAGTCSRLVAGSLECCSAGYRWNGSSCILQDACLAGTDNCVGIATCNDTPGSSATYTCTCPHAGYAGNGRSPGTGCTNINECGSNPCAPFGTGGGDGMGCTQRSLGSWSAPGYTCACQPGYESNGTTCALENECTAGTDDCHVLAACNDPTTAMGDFSCTCPTGYSGSGHGGMGCIDDNECALGTDDCDTNATCTNTPGSWSCACNTGFSGDGRTCADVDECLDPAFLAMCDPNSTCNNLFGTFECVCNTGYRGDGLVSCAEIDECAEATDDCDTNATCTNTPGSWSCACNAGWDGDGRTCTDIDECLDADIRSRCSTVAVCVNEPGSWRCECNMGFVGDGFTCADVDECADGTHVCHMDATCFNGIGDYACACNTGFRGSGFDCADVDECIEGTHGCVVNETCVNQIGAPNTCVCRTGYARNDMGACEVSCGDGIVVRGEGCDDLNTNDGDGCDAECQVEAGWACFETGGRESTCAETCGDGFVDEGEVCDDGAANSDTTADACRTTCVLASCGDGAVDMGEACDDGAGNDDTLPDACRTTCDLPFCGDGVVDMGEVCDPGGGVPGAAVAGTCTTLCLGDGGIDELDPPVLTGGACSCRASAPSSTSGLASMLALLGLGLLFTRRRR